MGWNVFEPSYKIVFIGECLVRTKEILFGPQQLRSKFIEPLRLGSNFVLASQWHGERYGS